MPDATQPRGFDPSQRQSRYAAFTGGSYNAETRTAEIVISSGAAVRRWFGFETLAISEQAVDLARVGMGQVRLLDHHNGYSREAVLGVLESAAVRDGQLVGTVRFAETEEGEAAAGQASRGELTGISAGYRILEWRLVGVDDNNVETWRADRWELLEVSLVSIPADPHAGVRSFDPAPASPPAAPVSPPPVSPAHPRGHVMPEENRIDAPASNPAPEATRSDPAPTPAAPAAPAPTPAPDAAAVATARAADMLNIGLRAGMSREDIDAAIRGTDSVEQFRSRAFEVLASRSQPVAPVAQVVRDETQTRLDGLTDAFLFRALAGQPGQPQMTDMGRPFADHRFSDAAAAMLNVRAPRLPAEREQVIQRAFHTTSDFPALLENTARRAALARYAVAPTTFRRWSAERTFVDFRPHSMARGGDFPTMLQVGESGELKVGTVSESRESVSVVTYGRQLRISRNILINDDLGEFGRILGSAGDRVARLRNQIAYASLLSNSAQGPLLATPNRNMFVSGNNNLAASGTVIDIAAIGAGRAAMARQTTLDGLALSGNTPTLLLCDWTRLTAAQQLLAPIVPAQTSNAVPNDFQSLTPVADAEIGTTTRWWLFADPAVTPNFVYGNLEGAQDFYTRTVEPPGVLGMSFEVYFDFAFGGIDFRGGYSNPGA